MFSLNFIPIKSKDKKESYLIYDSKHKRKLAVLNLDLYHDPKRTKGNNNYGGFITFDKSEQSDIPEILFATNFLKNDKKDKYLLNLGNLIVFFHEMGHVLRSEFYV